MAILYETAPVRFLVQEILVQYLRTLTNQLGVCVCVCVCERERERDRER